MILSGGDTLLPPPFAKFAKKQNIFQNPLDKPIGFWYNITVVKNMLL